jgi:hypothetical protein
LSLPKLLRKATGKTVFFIPTGNPSLATLMHKQHVAASTTSTSASAAKQDQLRHSKLLAAPTLGSAYG